MRVQIRDIGTYARIRATRVYANGELSRRSGLISTEYGKAAHIALRQSKECDSHGGR